MTTSAASTGVAAPTTTLPQPQLFQFGHPCEHQLKRTCIGGSHCPLNGYPDQWCCSFVKGRIHFKRDKPCEGQRCRWGFAHPPPDLFDSVTTILQEARQLALRIDDPADNGPLTIDNAHVSDTVVCCLRFLKAPPQAVSMKLGNLYAYAAVKGVDSRIFVQLLKPMKKPIDGYLLGAWQHLASLPFASAAAAAGGTPSAGATAASSPAAGGGGGKISLSKSAALAQKRMDDVADELRSDVVDVMTSALSQGGALVHRDDQTLLQAVYMSALPVVSRNKKKAAELLEIAAVRFPKASLSGPVPGAALAAAAAVETTAAGGSRSGSAGQPTPVSAAVSVTDPAAVTPLALPASSPDQFPPLVSLPAAAVPVAAQTPPSKQRTVAEVLSGSKGSRKAAAAAAASAAAAGASSTPPSSQAAADDVVSGAGVGAASDSHAVSADGATTTVTPAPPQPTAAGATTSGSTGVSPTSSLPPSPFPERGLLKGSHFQPVTSRDHSFVPITREVQRGRYPDVPILGGLFSLYDGPSTCCVLGPATKHVMVPPPTTPSARAVTPPTGTPSSMKPASLQQQQQQPSTPSRAPLSPFGVVGPAQPSSYVAPPSPLMLGLASPLAAGSRGLSTPPSTSAGLFPFADDGLLSGSFRSTTAGGPLFDEKTLEGAWRAWGGM